MMVGPVGVVYVPWGTVHTFRWPADAERGSSARSFPVIRCSVFSLRIRSPSSGSDLLFAFVLDGAGELEILVFRVRISQREAQAGQALAEVGSEGVVSLGRRRFLLLAAAVGRLRQPARSPRLGALGPVVARDVRLIAQVDILQGERSRVRAQPLELAVFLFDTDLEIAVARQAGPGRDQPADDHVLLQAHQVIPLAAHGGL